MILEIIELMGKMGARFTRNKILKVYDYLLAMMRDGRVITFRDDNKLVGFCTYSLCDNAAPFYGKGTWDYLSDDDMGDLAYIEMIVSFRWDKKLRNLIETTIASKHPNFKYGVWHRPGQDRDRIIIRRHSCTK
jgi:hypothetical protein